MDSPLFNVTKLQAHQQKILKALELLEAICKKNKLRYFLVGGTALGSVRHKGFIPWDDDIDIGMPRPDFEKFEQIINQSSLNDFIYIKSDSPSFPHPPFGVLSYYWEESGMQTIAPGLDIFPLDGVSESKIQQRLQKYASDVYHLAVYKKKPVNRGKIAEYGVAILLALLPSAVLKFMGKIGKLITLLWPYDDSQLIANVFGLAGFHREIMPKSYMGTGGTQEFEGRIYCAPEITDKYLTHLYRNYMSFPPADKQKPAHANFV